MNMFATIWLIIYSIMVLFIWYAIWKFTTEDNAEETGRKIRFLTSELNRYKSFAPKTELYKWKIIQLHNEWMYAKDIWAKFWMKKSTVTSALRKWWFGKKK